jgi:hypothetical protein
VYIERGTPILWFGGGWGAYLCVRYLVYLSEFADLVA